VREKEKKEKGKLVLIASNQRGGGVQDKKTPSPLGGGKGLSRVSSKKEPVPQ